MVIDNGVLNLGSGTADLVVGLGKLLDVVVTGQHWVDVRLRAALLQHLQDDRSILRIVLVPGIEHGFAEPGLGHR